jgi:hypothetical protein
MVPSCSLRINRGATAGIFDVDRTGKRQGRGAVKAGMKSECGELLWVDDAAFTVSIHRAGQCRGSHHADRPCCFVAS